MPFLNFEFSNAKLYQTGYGKSIVIGQPITRVGVFETALWKEMTVLYNSVQINGDII